MGMVPAVLPWAVERQSLLWGRQQLTSGVVAAAVAAVAAAAGVLASGASQSRLCHLETPPPTPSARAPSGRQDYCVRLSYCGKHSLLGSETGQKKRGGIGEQGRGEKKTRDGEWEKRKRKKKL